LVVRTDPTTDDQWALLSSLAGPEQNSLLFQQDQQDRSVELPAQGEAEEVAAAGWWLALIGEQPTHIHNPRDWPGMPQE